jgi:hypothetical protein
MKTGLALRELRLSGASVEDAVITFADGLNVIAGPSDTGKTYIAQCLSFLLGTGKGPKNIPQAAAYEAAGVLLITRADGTERRLSRRLDGSGAVQHATGGEPARSLRPQHDPRRADTLPAFLLDQSGLSGRVVRMRVYGQTRSLAFSDVARLFFVDEETVISERSPILSGQNTDRLVERRVFRLLLTGADDAGVVSVDKPEVARGHRAGRTEVLEELATSVRTDLRRLKVTGTTEDAERRAEEWTIQAKTAAGELDDAQRAAEPVEQRRREILDELRHTRSLSEHRREFQTRFRLLKAQYESDLDRLALVAQAGGRLDQLNEERCPVCGAAVAHQQHEHRAVDVSLGEIAESCLAEADKIRLLVRDLDATILANDAELASLGAQEIHQGKQLTEAEHELSSVIHPQAANAARALRASEVARSREVQTVWLMRRADELSALLTDAKTSAIPTRAEGSTEGASAAESEAFASRVEMLLKSWRFPDVGRVTWSESDEDIVVSGRSRASYGKGKRAIMRAAFNLGLLRVLTDQQRPSPGLVLIDSPLVVYREPDVGEEAFPPAVKQHFYEAVARDFADVQVVVFENDEPPASVAEHASVTVFTGTAQGRSGFIP